jgi:serine/threonine protein kinase
LLRQRTSFNEETAKFYAGCVTLAFEYMHSSNTLYRDLKPENLYAASSDCTWFTSDDRLLLSLSPQSWSSTFDDVTLFAPCLTSHSCHVSAFIASISPPE